MRISLGMKSRSSLVLAFGFGSLIVLIAVLGLGAIRRARAIYGEMEATQQSYLEAESFRPRSNATCASITARRVYMART